VLVQAVYNGVGLPAGVGTMRVDDVYIDPYRRG
jgi:hypothetical protein